MSFYQELRTYSDFPFVDFYKNISLEQARSAVAADAHTPEMLLALLSEPAGSLLEDMGQKAHVLTLQHFGKTIQLYTPLYISDFCENECLYCGFNKQNTIPRRKLTEDEVEKAAASIAATGINHILVLTGDSRAQSPLEYIKKSIQVIKRYFSSISVEIYALTREEYAQLIRAGVDGLTIYQETYDEKVFDRVHVCGPKKDYLFRLDAAERAARENIRIVNIGVLLGLGDWRKDVFFLGLHARYLQQAFPTADISVSFPRIRPHAGSPFTASCTVSDAQLVQCIIALRLFLPYAGITISTRESSRLRENLLPLGITRLSAGSSTKVGGQALESCDESGLSQFEIADQRSVADIKSMLEKKGYQPVMKDWLHI